MKTGKRVDAKPMPVVLNLGYDTAIADKLESMRIELDLLRRENRATQNQLVQTCLVARQLVAQLQFDRQPARSADWAPTSADHTAAQEHLDAVREQSGLPDAAQDLKWWKPRK